MKTSHLRILLATLLLWTLVMLSACGGSSNTNGSNNASGNANVGSSNPGEVASLAAANCADANTLRTWINSRLNHEREVMDNQGNEHEVHYDGDLSQHSDTSSGKPAPIVVDVSGPNGTEHRFTVTIVGILRSTVPMAPTQTVPTVPDKHRARKNFERIIEALTDRSGTSPCKIDVVFRAPMSAAMLEFGEDGFESSSCDWPLVPCDGACLPNCIRKSAGNLAGNSPTSRAPGNSGGNSNRSNSNSNGSNSNNSNRKQSP